MNSFTQIVWKKVVSFLGSAAGLIRPVAAQIQIAKDSGDVEKLRALATEGLEACDAERALWIAMLADLEDGTLDLAETGELAVLFENVIDEREDMVTLHDEDDPVSPTTEGDSPAE